MLLQHKYTEELIPYLMGEVEDIKWTGEEKAELLATVLSLNYQGDVDINTSPELYMASFFAGALTMKYTKKSFNALKNTNFDEIIKELADKVSDFEATQLFLLYIHDINTNEDTGTIEVLDLSGNPVSDEEKAAIINKLKEVLK